MEGVAIFPWSRDRWKAFLPRQKAIELLDHVSRILELYGVMEIAISRNRGSNAWSEADHSTARSAHAICKGTIGMARILVAQLNAH